MDIEKLAGERNLGMVAAFILAYSLIAYFGLKRRDVIGTAAVNSTLTSFAMFGSNLLFGPVCLVLVVWCQTAYDILEIPHIPATFWQNTSVFVTVVLALVVKDFVDYWNHRLMHTKWIWPIHAVHHSDTYVNGFTAYRFHVFEFVLTRLAYVVFLTWLGFSNLVVALVAIIEALHNAYVHFEVDIDHGPLNWLIASPRFHRWHHADNPAVFGKNLATFMPLFDVIFGTYSIAGRCQEPMGALSDGIAPHNPFKLLVLPFVLWFKRFNKTPGVE